MALGIPSSSPAVNFREIDLTGQIGNASTSVGVIALLGLLKMANAQGLDASPCDT